MIQDSIQKIEQLGLQTELDYERALLIERKLRIMAKTEPNYDQWRQRLRNCIEAYEDIHWSLSNEVDEKQIARSEKAESIIEQERVFIQLRKKKIRERLSFFHLNQKDLGLLLGHKSTTYISELINGVCPFTLRDLIIIHEVFDISWEDLIPTFLADEDIEKIIENIKSIDNKPLLDHFLGSIQ